MTDYANRYTTSIMNSCFLNGILPGQWKQSERKMPFHAKNKDYKETNDNCPNFLSIHNTHVDKLSLSIKCYNNAWRLVNKPTVSKTFKRGELSPCLVYFKKNARKLVTS